ncbi:hypothetical protein R3P38DRAFT_2679091 [Favolaschia claudopus]|uniref:Uncharacterized protein n=1 Tax=Favolaschia claudopus TaxID=2862362 RepID=A0AAW0E238_9AGAR
MASIIRSAKSGSDWTENELDAYNIHVVYQNAPTFFQVPTLPSATVHHDILHSTGSAQATDPAVYQVLRTMELAMFANTEESAVDDFAFLLLQALGYLPIGRVVRTRKDLPLVICGEQRHAQTDVCIVDAASILLLVQEDKKQADGGDPIPQLVAEAIGAFQSNNLTRVQALGLDPLPAKIIPGITMKGTSPIFFKIPVSAELTAAVRGGCYPHTPTVIHAHLPTIPRPAERWNEGMKPLDNRAIILSCFEAFKQFVN